ASRADDGTNPDGGGAAPCKDAIVSPRGRYAVLLRLDGRPMPPLSPNRSPLPALGLLLVGSIGIAAVWVVLARFSGGGQMSWFAVLAAVDASLMLRLGNMRPGLPRAASAVLGTSLAIALANWGDRKST